MDDVPTINVSTAPCGHTTNPHRVRSAADLTCVDCGAPVAAVLVGRLVVAAERKKEVDRG